MPVLLYSTSSYFDGVSKTNPSTRLADYDRRHGQATGPNDISPVTKQYVAGMDEFTFQIMNLKPIYGYGFHTLQVNGTTRTLKSGRGLKIGFVDSKGKRIDWSATPTKYGFDIQFFVNEDKNSSGPAIFEIAGQKKDGRIISLIERFTIDTNAPPQPYGVEVTKRGFHTVDVVWHYTTGFESANKNPTHDHDLSGFHIWASTASLTNTTQVTSSAPIMTVPASDAQTPALTSRSFATSINGIDQSMIVKDKTLYFYVSSFDDVGNENLKSLKSSNLVFGSPGIPTGSNPNVWIPIPETGVGQLDWSSFSETNASQSARSDGSPGDKYSNAPVYTTGTYDVNKGPVNSIFNNVLHTASTDLVYKTMFVTSSVAVTGSHYFEKYVSRNKPLTTAGSGALFLVVNTRSFADLDVINTSGQRFNNTARMFFIASGSQSFSAGPTGSVDTVDTSFSYPFPMLPMKPDTDYIISFRVKATSSISGSEVWLPPLKMGFTGSELTPKFSMSRDIGLQSPSIAPLTFSVPYAGPGVDSLLDLTTTPDPSNVPSTAFSNDLRYQVGAEPVRVQIKFNSGELETKKGVYIIQEQGGTPVKIGESSNAPNFDMVLPYFFVDTPSSVSTGSIMGPLAGPGWYSDGATLRSTGLYAAGGGGIVPSDAITLSNNAPIAGGLETFKFPDSASSRYASGAGNSGSRFSGTWLGEYRAFMHNKAGPPSTDPNVGDVGWMGEGHFMTGSNFMSFTGSAGGGELQAMPMIASIGLTGSRIYQGQVSSTPILSMSQEHKKQVYPFNAPRKTSTEMFSPAPLPGGTTKYLVGWPYKTPGGDNPFSTISGSVMVSGSVLPSFEKLGIRMDKGGARPTPINQTGHHYIFEFVSSMGVKSKPARTVLLRALEGKTSVAANENSIVDGTWAAASSAPAVFKSGFNPIYDSGSFYYYMPPSASYSKRTITDVYSESDAALNMIFSWDSGTGPGDEVYRNEWRSSAQEKEEFVVTTDRQRVFYVSGSGLLEQGGGSNVVAVYVHSDDPEVLSLTPAPDAIQRVPSKLNEFTDGGSSAAGFGVVGQNLGGVIAVGDGSNTLGHTGSAVLKIRVSPFKMINSNPGSTVGTTLRFKIVNKGGFTGSIYNGTQNDIAPSDDKFINDPRCGEYLLDELPSEWAEPPTNRDFYRANNASELTHLTMSFKYTNFPGGGGT